MARFRELKTNFTAGEIDPLLLARSDVASYHNAGQKLRNAIVIPQGGVEMRPGSRYVWTVPEVSAGVLSNVRLASFQFNTEQTYLMVFHHLAVSIFRNGELQATVTTPYTSDDLVASYTSEGDLISTGIYWTQSKDTMILFHQDHPIQELKRAGSHTAWTFGAFAVKNIPRYDFGEVYTLPDEIGVDEVQEIEFPNPGSQGNWTEGDTFALIVEDVTSTNIKWSATADTMRDRLQAALRAMDNTSDTGIAVTHDSPGTGNTVDAVFTVTFSGDDGQRPWGSIFYEVKSAEQVPSIDIFVETEGQYPGEVVWSATRGYPRCGLFFQGRLWCAGTTELPHYVWASRTGAPADFNSKLFADDYGIAVQADTSDVPAFIACHAGRHLQFFSTSGEFYVPVSEREGVTPGNIALRRTTSRGCKAGLRVFEVDGATHFIQRRGGALREFIFTDVEQAYQANNISLLSPHLMRDPVDFALRRSTSTTDADYEFMCNSDGTMTVFCTLRTQEVNGMTLWVTDGEYRSVGVVLDEAYFAVKRTVDGADVLFIERMDDSLTVDCGLSGTSAASATLAHLPNATIEHVLDGNIQQAVTADAGGVATFARSADVWQAGIRYAEPDADNPGLIWVCQTLPLEVGLPDGAMLGRKRRIVGISVRLHETSALVLNGNRVSFQKFGSTLLDENVTPFTGVKQIRGLLGWDHDGLVTIGGDQSLGGKVLGLSFKVSV